jgi:hypothetical protein
MPGDARQGKLTGATQVRFREAREEHATALQLVGQAAESDHVWLITVLLWAPPLLSPLLLPKGQAIKSNKSWLPFIVIVTCRTAITAYQHGTRAAHNELGQQATLPLRPVETVSRYRNSAPLYTEGLAV